MTVRESLGVRASIMSAPAFVVTLVWLFTKCPPPDRDWGVIAVGSVIPWIPLYLGKRRAGARLVDTITRVISGRRWVYWLVTNIAAEFRGALDAWIVYLVSFLVMDVQQARTTTHFFLVFGSTLAVLPLQLLLRACEVSRKRAVSFESTASEPVVLFLRSFTTDGVFHDEGQFHGSLSGHSDEEMLNNVLSGCGLGQFVGLARPTTLFQELGPDHVNIRDRDWRVAVSDLLSRSTAVIMRLGTSESMQWELDAVVRSGKLARTLFLLPASSSHEERAQRYHSMLLQVPDRRPYPAFPSELEEGARFLFFEPSGIAHVITDAEEPREHMIRIFESTAKPIVHWGGDLTPFFAQLGALPKKRFQLKALPDIFTVLPYCCVGIYCFVFFFTFLNRRG